VYFNYHNSNSSGGAALRKWSTTGPLTSSAVGTFTTSLYALAFNPVDRFLYALNPSRVLVRIDANGVLQTLGTVSLNFNASLSVGDFDSSGNYWILQGDSGILYRININTLNGDTIPLNQSGRKPDDLAWHNNNLYFIEGRYINSSLEPVILYSVNPSTRNITPIGDTGLARTGIGSLSQESIAEFALYSDGNSLFSWAIPTGSLWEINPNTAQSLARATLNDPSPYFDEKKDATRSCFIPASGGTDLGIIKSSPSSSSGYVPGQQVEYEIRVGNAGPNGVQNALVYDPLPAGLTNASWTCQPVEPGNPAACVDTSGQGGIDGARVNISVGGIVAFTLTATVQDGYSADITNTASVAPPAGMVDTNEGNNNKSVTLKRQQLSADLSLTKTSPASTYAPGGPVEFEITVGNSGPNDVQNASVDDPLPAGLADASWTCAPGLRGTNGPAICAASSGTGAIADAKVHLPSGSTAVFTLTATVQAGFSADITNTAVVTPPPGIQDPDGNDPNGNNYASVTLQRMEQQAPFACDGTMYFKFNSNLHPTLYAWDRATNPLTPFALGDWLPSRTAYGLAFNRADGFIYMSESTGIYRLGSDGSLLNLGLPLGGVPGVVGAAGAFDPDGNYYVVSGSSNFYRVDVTQMTAEFIATIGMRPGDLAWYRDRLYFVPRFVVPLTLYSIDPNDGSLHRIGEIGLNDLPSQPDFALYGAADGLYGIRDTTENLYKFNTDTGAATVFRSLNGMVDAAYGKDAANCPTATLFSQVADLAITKTSGTDTYRPGMTTAYTITVTNNGPSDVQGAVVEDQLPPGITMASWTCGGETGGGKCGAANGFDGISTTADLPAGASVTYWLTMNVPSTFVGPLTNTATVTVPPDITDPDLDNNTDTDTDEPELNPPPQSCDYSANGSFEEPNIETTPDTPESRTDFHDAVNRRYALWRVGKISVDGWDTEQGTVDIWRHHANAYDGSQAIDLWGVEPSIFRQTFEGLAPGRRYTFSVAYSGRSRLNAKANVQLANGPGAPMGTIMTLRPLADAIWNGNDGIPATPQFTLRWDTFRHDFTAAGTEATIQFVDMSANDGTNSGLFIDNFVFTSPDPCEADLAIEKTSEDGNYGYVPGEDIVYKIKVSNHGTVGVRGAVVNDPLPDGFTEAHWTCEPATEGPAGTCETQSDTGPIVNAKVNLPGGPSVAAPSSSR
jgi:uncharacterized repeat protein (TIGR01451 family)